MDEKKIFMGIGALVVVLLGVALMNSGEEDVDINKLIAEKMAPMTEAVENLGGRVDEVGSTLDGVTERVGAVEGSLGDVTGQVAEVAGSLEGVTGRVDEVAGALESVTGRVDDVAGSLEGMTATVAAAASVGDLDALRSQIDDVAAQTGALSDNIETLRTQPAAAATAQPSTEAAAAPAAEDAGEPGFMPGQTAVFADGQLRAFVSMLDAEAGSARLSILGDMMTMTSGSAKMLSVGKDYCELSLGAVSAQGAVLDAICGDDLPTPEGVSAGSTALLMDGALRVFVSRVTDEGARLSANGTLVNLAVGRSAPLSVGDDNCRVHLDAVDRGHATVGAACGDDVNVSELVSPGATAVLGDGAARAFLASVDEDGTTARFAVNGQSLQSGGSGTSVEVDGGCVVALEDLVEGQASFSYSCAE